MWFRNKVPNNESLYKVSSEADVHKCSSKYFFLIISHRYFPVNIVKFKNSVFIENLQWLLLLALDICRSSLLNQRHNLGWFLLKRFLDLFKVHYIISRNIPAHFCWLTCRKQKLIQGKTLQHGLFVLILDFWQFRHSNFSWVKS